MRFRSSPVGMMQTISNAFAPKHGFRLPRRRRRQSQESQSPPSMKRSNWLTRRRRASRTSTSSSSSQDVTANETGRSAQPLHYPSSNLREIQPPIVNASDVRHRMFRVLHLDGSSRLHERRLKRSAEVTKTGTRTRGNNIAPDISEDMQANADRRPDHSCLWCGHNFQNVIGYEAYRAEVKSHQQECHALQVSARPGHPGTPYDRGLPNTNEIVRPVSGIASYTGSSKPLPQTPRERNEAGFPSPKRRVSVSGSDTRSHREARRQRSERGSDEGGPSMKSTCSSTATHFACPEAGCKARFRARERPESLQQALEGHMHRRHGLKTRVHVDNKKVGGYEASMLSHYILSSLSLSGKSRDSVGSHDSIMSSPLAGPETYVKDERRYPHKVCRDDAISPVQSTHGVFGFASPDGGSEPALETAPPPFRIRRKPVPVRAQLPTMHQSDKQTKALRRKALNRTPAFRQPEGRHAFRNNQMNEVLQAT